MLGVGDDWGRKGLTEGVFVKTAISTFRVGKTILPLSSADGVKSSLPLGVTSASQTIDHGSRGRQNVDGCFLYGWEDGGE